jgi:hypothetical protein
VAFLALVYVWHCIVEGFARRGNGDPRACAFQHSIVALPDIGERHPRRAAVQKDASFDFRGAVTEGFYEGRADRKIGQSIAGKFCSGARREIKIAILFGVIRE